MSVRILEGWTETDWDEEVGRHGEATFFHTRLWSRICCRSFPQLRDRSLWIEVTTESGSSRHLLPLLEWRRIAGLVTTTHCSFPHIYGGPLPVRGAAGVSVLGEVLGFLASLRGTVLVTANPLAEGLPEPGPPSGRGGTISPSSPWERRLDHTHLRTLPKTDAEFWEDELPPRKRNDVRRISKKGVVIEESRDPADVSRLYQLYLASFTRWGGPPAFVHPETFYQSVVQLGGDSVRLSVARFENQVIGGVIALRFGSAVHYFAGYFDAEAKALRPNVLLQVDSIRNAIQDGFAFYDFLPSGANESVEQFKEGLGGVRVEVPVWSRRPLGHRILARARGR